MLTSCCSANSFAKAPDGSHDAQVVELREVQLVGQGLNVAGYLGTVLADFFQPLFRRRRSPVAIGLLQFHR